MSFTYHIDKANCVVFTVWEGTLDIQTFETLQNTLRDDPDFKPYYSVLTDLRGVTKTDITSKIMNQIAKNSPFDGSGRRAFVVGSHLMHGMSRMYQTYYDEGSDRTKQFRDMTEARKWLGLPLT